MALVIGTSVSVPVDIYYRSNNHVTILLFPLFFPHAYSISSLKVWSLFICKFHREAYCHQLFFLSVFFPVTSLFSDTSDTRFDRLPGQNNAPGQY